MSGATPTRILLVGFMGAGKSAVGREVARRLGWRFADFDEAVEAEAGASIPDIFASRGEDAFRRLEEGAAARLLGEERVVLASGGGWAAVPGRIDGVPPGTAVVWLQVSADTALERARAEPGRRPLLAVDDAVATARELLAARSAAYASAPWTVDTEGRSVEDVSARILEILLLAYPDFERNAC